MTLETTTTVQNDKLNSCGIANLHSYAVLDTFEMTQEEQGFLHIKRMVIL